MQRPKSQGYTVRSRHKEAANQKYLRHHYRIIVNRRVDSSAYFFSYELGALFFQLSEVVRLFFSKKALNVLIQQSEVDPKRISIIGHSEGTIIAPRVAIDNSTKVKNIILIGTVAQKVRDLIHYQAVSVQNTLRKYWIKITLD